jgi:outer membrane protein assembly factor BamA
MLWALICALFIVPTPVFSQYAQLQAQEAESTQTAATESTILSEFVIKSVRYEIKGITNQRILQGKAEIKEGTRFATKEELESFIADRRQRLMNERVLESVTIEYALIGTGKDPQEVDILVNVEDSWNIIALPYFRYDTNDGFLLSIRGRDYNFLGSMQALVLNLDFSIDATGKQSYGGYTSFGVPFALYGRDSGVNVSETLSVHADSRPVTSVTNLSFWHNLTEGLVPLRFEASQGLQFNPDSVIGDPDPYLLLSKLSLSSLINTGMTVGSLGAVSYSPSISAYQYWRPNTQVRSDRQGLRATFSHGLSLGRIDWIENMRRGVSASLTNGTTYNVQSTDLVSDLDVSFNYNATLEGKLGFNAKAAGFYSLTNSARDGLGSSMRGIKNARLQGASAAFVNLEMPVKLFDFPTHIFIKKNWFDFEFQASPFIDLGYVMGSVGTVAENYNFWYAGGLEFFVFPLRMRTFIVRASIGFDLDAVLQNKSITAPSPRDGSSVYELFFGLGLFL